MDNLTTLQMTDTKLGSGAEATAGKQVTVHYTGWLYDGVAADHHGSKFDSSRGTATIRSHSGWGRVRSSQAGIRAWPA